jgi:phosphatidylglycerophosphate synthase
VNKGGYDRWLTANSASGLAVLGLALPYPSAAGIAFLGWGCVFSGWLSFLGGGPRTPADVLTLLRLLILFAGVALLVLFHLPLFALMLFTVSLLLDLVDGWLARRHGETAWGAVYDMESDQAWVMGIAIGIHALHPAVAWVLLFPALRFLQVLFLKFTRLPARDPKPVDGNNTRARTVFAIVAGGLLLSLWPDLPTGLRTGLLLGCLLLLSGSFLSDQCHLWKQRRKGGAL